mgnify:CR=1 FL=1
MQDLVQLAQDAVIVIQSIAVFILIAGSLYVIRRALFRFRWLAAKVRYRQFRKELGGVILVAFDFLTAGLAILTAMVTPSLSAIVALGLMVLIRAFLSVMLTLEIEGRWPWQLGKELQSPSCEPHQPNAHLPPNQPLRADASLAEPSRFGN